MDIDFEGYLNDAVEFFRENKVWVLLIIIIGFGYAVYLIVT